MQVTEEEAKAKWCPFARTLDHQGNSGLYEFPVVAAVNREVGDFDKGDNETVVIFGRHRCIASACMAWRRGPTSWPQFHAADNTVATDEPSRPAGVSPDWEWKPYSDDDHEQNAGWLEPKASAKARQPGFCGLAGAPQS